MSENNELYMPLISKDRGKEGAASLPPIPEKPMMYLPRNVEHLDYLELREQVYEWFRSRKLPIWKAAFVCDCLKYDLTDQVCSGLKVRE